MLNHIPYNKQIYSGFLLQYHDVPRKTKKKFVDFDFY